MQPDTIAATTETPDREEILWRLRNLTDSLPLGVFASLAPSGMREIGVWIELVDRQAQAEAEMYERVFRLGAQVLDARDYFDGDIADPAWIDGDWLD